MKKDFVSYEQALELKELGFNEPCLGKFVLLVKGDTVPHFQYNNRRNEAESIDEGMWYNHNGLNLDYVCSAPTLSQAFRFFREKYNLHVNKTGNVNYTSFNITEPKIELLSFLRYMDTKNHYEEAESACLDKLIELAKMLNLND